MRGQGLVGLFLWGEAPGQRLPDGVAYAGVEGHFIPADPHNLPADHQAPRKRQPGGSGRRWPGGAKRLDSGP
ncbi:MAG: hypothetical protein GY947_17795 [Rhodobacteraceae bacterium]|nr:hypothetical protein [Paracoccaceae bacterium]